MTLAELVDRVGRANVYWETHRLEWGDQEWLWRRKKLLELLDEMSDRLEVEGQTVEDFGWRIAPDGQWYRDGQPVPPRRADCQAELAKMFPAYSRAAKREQQEEEQPVLAGTEAGFTPF